MSWSRPVCPSSSAPAASASWAACWRHRTASPRAPSSLWMTGSKAPSPLRSGRWCEALAWSGCMMCGQRCRPPRSSPGDNDGRNAAVPGMKGKWAQGIQPRNFAWVIKDKLAVCERPGGYGANHRRVRRQEEIIWIREQGFSCVVSLIPSPHNLHNYDELAVTWRHRPFTQGDDAQRFVAGFFPELRTMIAEGQKVLVHQDELGDRVSGLMAGFLLWSGMVESGPQAISITEQLVHRQLGPTGRQLVTIAAELPKPV